MKLSLSEWKHDAMINSPFIVFLRFLQITIIISMHTLFVMTLTGAQLRIFLNSLSQAVAIGWAKKIKMTSESCVWLLVCVYMYISG